MRSLEHIILKPAGSTLQFGQRRIVGVLVIQGKVEHRKEKTGIEHPSVPNGVLNLGMRTKPDTPFANVLIIFKSLLFHLPPPFQLSLIFPQQFPLAANG